MTNFPGRGFYRGNQDAARADANRAFGGLTNAQLSAVADRIAAMPSVDTVQLSPTDLGPTKMSVSAAMQMGFTGDPCDQCGSMKMQRTGHCNTCAECGTTTGCS